MTVLARTEALVPVEVVRGLPKKEESDLIRALDDEGAFGEMDFLVGGVTGTELDDDGKQNHVVIGGSLVRGIDPFLKEPED